MRKISVHRSGQAGGLPDEEDGRTRRSLDSQQRIVEALLALIEEGNLSPSAEKVSERAGVGLRTVFRHFKDMESLHRAASAAIAVRLQQVAREPFEAAEWKQQLHELIERRARVYEKLSPVLRAEQKYRAGSPILQAAHVNFVAELRRILVERLSASHRISGDMIEAIDLLLSFEAWQRLRVQQRLSILRAKAVLRNTIDAIVAGA